MSIERREAVLMWLGVVVVMGALVLCGVLLALRQSAIEDRDDALAQVGALTRSRTLPDAEKLERIEDVADDTQPAPVVVAGRDGRDGKDGERGPGPTDAQIALGIANYFDLHPDALPRDGIDGATGATGESGERGPGPTDAQVALGVANYLAANPPPPGPRGETGADGADGADAPPPTDAQVQAAVLAILAAHPEMVPAGPKGDTGPPPASWTFVWNRRTYVCSPTESGGVVFRCVES